MSHFSWKQLFDNLMRRRSRGFIAQLFRYLILLPLSLLYGAVVSVRRWLYSRGVFQQKRASLRVISIGNLVIGGSGKTPVAAFIAERLAAYAPTAILSRGYCSEAEKRTAPSAVNPCDPLAAIKWGDEPTLLARRLPSVTVFSGPDRVASASLASDAGFQIAVLDDGMQHLVLARDIEVVVLDASDPLASFQLIPFGLMREPVRNLREADLVVLTRASDLSAAAEMKRRVALFTDAPIMVTQPQVDAVLDWRGESHAIGGLKVAALCAIAQPERFLETLHSLSAQVTHRLFLPDHDAVSPEMLNSFVEECKKMGVDAIVCTEKDWVKLHNFPTVLPMLYVRLSLAILEAPTNWEALLLGVSSDSKKSNSLNCCGSQCCSSC